MPRFPSCRLIVDAEPRSGAWNMAFDEALLESAVNGGLPTVRWYTWLRPTVSLGYFQPAEAAAPWCDRPEVDVVRRLTGGGAIVHHHEWTYSVTLPALSPLLRHPYELYDLVHGALIVALQRVGGISLSLRGPTRRAATEPVLCYLREDEHDVCWDGVKIIGSAQRRRRGALLQHGSLLLRESIYAPGVRGLYDMAPSAEPELRRQAAVLFESLGRTVAEGVQVDDFTPSERACAEELFQQRSVSGEAERLPARSIVKRL
jgi:lipoate-protein ligase A